MNIEQKINYQLNKYPRVKKVVKSAYQHTMYSISPKTIKDGDIVRISPNDNNHEYFFGYYDKSPWDASDRYVLCLKAKNTWSDVSPKEKADIILIDTVLNENDINRVRKIADTSAWNVQQSCMLQWLGPDYSSHIIFNDYREGKYVSVIKSIDNGDERIIEAPVYSVSADGKTALSLDFSRLYNLRPGYGYYNVPEKTKDVSLPNTTAIWKIDLEKGEISDLLNYTDFASFQPRQEMKEKEAVHKVNHIMISPSGNRFMVLYRWIIKERKYTRLITCNIDGTDMYVLSDDDMVSHCFWKDDTHILAFENKKESGPGYYLMTDKTQEYKRCWPELTGDGHPSYNPDRSLIVTDSYPDRARVQLLRIMHGENSNPVIVAKVLSPFKYDNDTRCDLHPRWNHSGDKICFDSVFEGHRGLYSVDIPRTNTIELSDLVSVVIPVFNDEQYLERCVKSVMNQTYKNIEVILVNDGSTDHSLDVCNKLQNEYPTIKVLNKTNGGSSSARNAGIKVAKGRYIAFLDSDDWVTPDCYEYMLRLSVCNKADITDVMVYQVKTENDAIPTENEKIEILIGNSILYHYLYRGMSEQNGAPYSACRKLYKIELFQGDTANFAEGTVNEDICFNYRILRKCEKVVVSNQIKYLYFQGKSSVTNGALKKTDLALLNVSNDLVKLSENTNDPKIIELAKMKEARSYFSLLARAAKYGIDGNTIRNPNELVDSLRANLKTNLRILLRSPMSLERKALAVAFVLNYNFFAKLIRKII